MKFNHSNESVFNNSALNYFLIKLKKHLKVKLKIQFN